MKLTITLVFFVYTLNLMAQTAQEFLISCFKDEQNKGATNIILSATLCSVCRGESVYEGFIFFKDKSETYNVRYLKYIHRPASLKVLKDKIFSDDNIKSIFKIEETYYDSIYWQLSNLEGLLTDTIIENGQKIYSGPINHGKVRYLKIYNNDKIASSIQSVINLNEIFDRAYYYWLLNSAINNYINDFLQLRL